MSYPWFKANLEKKFVLNNLKSIVKHNSLTMGKYCYELENKLKKILNMKYVVLTTSGTSALFLASLASGINKNKKVYLSNLNWVATSNPPKFLGSKISMIDTKNKSDQIDFQKLNKLIKKSKPDVVFLTHLNGEPTYNTEFLNLKKKKKFIVIEDSAQAFMVKTNNKKFCGTIFDIGCFSLSVTKLSSMIYGGFCVTNNKILAEKMRAIRNNGVSALPENAWLQTSSITGLNLKPSNLHAIFGLQNLKGIHKHIQKVKKIHNYYSQNLNNKKIKFIKKNIKRVIPIYNYIETKNRRKFISFCKKKKIGIHLGIRGLHENKPFKASKKKYTNSQYFSDYMVRIPSGPGYSISEIKKICNTLNKF